MKSYSSREVLQMLTNDGWYIINKVGSHLQLKHPTKPGKVTVIHPKKDYKIKTLKTIFEQVGIEI